MIAKVYNFKRVLDTAQESPKAYFLAATEAHNTGQSDKATCYLRMALNSHNTDFLNQFDLKSLGEPNNA